MFKCALVFFWTDEILKKISWHLGAESVHFSLRNKLNYYKTII